MIGKTISHYRILEKLGEGGMGVVYKAEDENLHRTVALKFLRVDAIGDRQLQGRFWKEAEAAAALDHPNITTVHEIAEAGGQTFIAMALVEGESLAAKIKQRPLPLDKALGTVIQIAEALQAAHETELVHRDIKPSNIMVTSKGQVKVMDFGLAHLAGQTRITKTGTIMGTPAYMSPEQYRGESVDHRTDIWSLGVVVYEMVTGQLPFKGDIEQAVAVAIQNDEPEPVTALRSGVPMELEWIVGKALAKSPGERYQHVEEMAVDLRALRSHLEQSISRSVKEVAPLAQPQPRRSILGIALAVGVSALAFGFAIGWWFTTSSGGGSRFPADYRLARLTSDTGLTYQPALSPDGKLVAYASDRAGKDNLDIWIKTVAGGEPRQLTTHPTGDSEPTFSPDSSRIAFRSDRNGGGIYVMSVLGGELQLIAAEGLRPRFSPDGQRIAYWVGERLVVDGQVFVVSSAGGAPTRVGSTLTSAGYPVWSPDGEQLLVLAKEEPADPSDWWVIPLDADDPIRTNVMESVREHGIEGGLIFRPRIPPEAWRPEDNSVMFSGRLGGSTNLWSIQVSPDNWQTRGDPERITFGSGLETHASRSRGGRIAFASMVQNTDVFALPVEANSGKVTGGLQRLTRDAADDVMPTVSLDGKTIAFLSKRLGNRDVWVKDLKSGMEEALTVTPQNELGPKISRDGSKVVYRDGEDLFHGGLYLKEVSGGLPQEICGDCGDPFDWFWDGSKLLHRIGPRSGIGLFDLVSQENLEVLRHPEHEVFGFQFSPDGKWIAFHLNLERHTQVFVIPFGGRLPLHQGDRIAITDASSEHRHPRWSPDGDLLYYQSERDGFRCIWAQRLHPQTKEPVGEPFEVYPSHSARLSLWNCTNPAYVWVGVARDKLVFTMGEITGNIWMMELTEQ